MILQSQLDLILSSSFLQDKLFSNKIDFHWYGDVEGCLL